MTIQTVDNQAEQIVNPEKEDIVHAPIQGAIFEEKSRGVSVVVAPTEPLSLVGENAN
jgi:hypothetical protein